MKLGVAAPAAWTSTIRPARAVSSPWTRSAQVRLYEPYVSRDGRDRGREAAARGRDFARPPDRIRQHLRHRHLCNNPNPAQTIAVIDLDRREQVDAISVAPYFARMDHGAATGKLWVSCDAPPSWSSSIPKRGRLRRRSTPARSQPLDRADTGWAKIYISTRPIRSACSRRNRARSPRPSRCQAKSRAPKASPHRRTVAAAGRRQL